MSTIDDVMALIDEYAARVKIEPLRWKQPEERKMIRAAVESLAESKPVVARPLAEWHEDDGPVLWWSFPVQEPPYSGDPNDLDWPGYHTHWTPVVIPKDPEGGE